MELRNGKQTVKDQISIGDLQSNNEVILVYKEMEDSEATFLIDAAMRQMQETPEWVEAARQLAGKIEDELGDFWTVIIGGYFGMTTNYLRNHFLHMSIRGVTVIIFKVMEKK